MKIKILGFIGAILLGISSFVNAQAPWVAPSTFANGTNYGVVRGYINTNFTNAYARDLALLDSVGRLTDSLYQHNVRMLSMQAAINVLRDTNVLHNVRLMALELGGGGSGSITSVSNGLTLSSGALTLGGTLTQSTAEILGLYYFTLTSSLTTPTVGTTNYYYGTFGTAMEFYNSVYTSSVVTTYNKMSLPNTGYWNLDGKTGTYGRGRFYYDATGIHLYIKTTPFGGGDIASISEFGGIRYDVDFSANYTNRSLTDKEYVDNKVAAVGDTTIIQIICTSGDVPATTTSTGYVLTVADDLTGSRLIKVEGRSAVPGIDGTVAITPYRHRTINYSMVTAAASLTTDATINTANDDLLNGDSVYIEYLETGASTPSNTLFAILTFVKN